MSIFPIILELGLCISFSTCSGTKLKGYCIPPFRPEALSKALIESALPPAQQIMVGSNDTALNTCEQTAHYFLQTGHLDRNEQLSW